MPDVQNKNAVSAQRGAEENSNDFASALTPKQIVEKLDQYIIGQTKAKRGTAAAA